MASLLNEQLQLAERIGRIIDGYSTTIIRLRTNSNDPKIDHVYGSGTFITLNGKYGILTAQHVAKEFVSVCKLGLVLKNSTHTFNIDSNHYIVHEIAEPISESEGPDLAFIQLFPPDIATIKTYKTFLDLSFEKKKILRRIPRINEGIWFIWGTPDEHTSEEIPEDNYLRVLGIHTLCGPTRAVNEFFTTEYDYIDVEVEYGNQLSIPLSFGGCSGGGLWQVMVNELRNGILEAEDYIYSGIIFYETKLENKKRYLRCHGRRSLYGKACNEITSI